MKDLGSQGLAKERVEKDKSMFGGKEIKGKVLAVMSALRLPNEIKLVDSLASAVVNADFVSLNIPYIKGEGGTHGIIGQEIIDLLKPDAVILNFARGELVDS